MDQINALFENLLNIGLGVAVAVAAFFVMWADIIRRLEANGYVTTEGTRAMLRTLEGPECSADSAISVATEVIASLQGNALLTQVELILATIIAALQRGRERTSVLLEFRDALESRLALAPLSQARLLRSVDMYIQLQT